MQTQEAAYWMLQELKERRLEVVKVGYLRQAISTNPSWYQELCRIYSARRRRRPKVRTYIKRCHVLRVLAAIAHDKQNMDTAYAQRLLPFIEAYGE